MRPFEYAQPSTKEQAAALLGSSWDNAAVLAGGTDLMSQMKDNIAAPKRLVDIKGIQEFTGIQYSAAAGLRLGALVTFEELREHRQVRTAYRGLTQAAEGITSAQIRNRGTVGGDLVQRPRCWYFRNGFGLVKKDEPGRPADMPDDDRYCSIFGNDGPAAFVNPSSLAPLLMALGARAKLYSASGTREVPLEQFFLIPKIETDRENVLRPNEILTEIVVPPGSWKTAVYEVRQKEGLDWPLAAAAVALQMSGNTVQTARVVLGHVAPIPWRALEAEQALAAKSITEDTAMAAGQAAVEKAKPLSQNGYKVQLARVAVKRALLRAVEGGA
ncbi:MAG: xanthine dehydrogenase family protein subunit M [Acidobacteria bacterium]|nr:xanthine dehydrogenase family protein subunit M [Acidobacteriota bacterium]